MARVSGIALGALVVLGSANASAQPDPVQPQGAEPEPGTATPSEARPGPTPEPAPEPIGAVTPAPRDSDPGTDFVDDASFGPILTIEAIEVAGNESTAEQVILRLLPIAVGERLRAGDPRFQRARFKLLATGYFREVELVPRRGSERGKVILGVQVKERGTVVLENLYFGTSVSTPWWVGLDITERNFFGTGLGVGLGGVYGASSEITGSRDQWALTLRLANTALLGSRYGIHGSVLYAQASEAFRVSGDPADALAEDFAAFDYSRLGFTGGVGVDLSATLHLRADARVEWVDAELPDVPLRELQDGSMIPVDVGLEAGSSRVITASFGLDRDTRTDPVLPFNGSRLLFLAEVGGWWLGSSYDFAVGLARYQHWWPVVGKKHVVSVHLTGGLVLGTAPLPDRLHVSDFNRLLPPRAFGMVLSTQPSPDLLGVGADDASYGQAGGSLVWEYSYQLFRERFRVYGGDLFVGAGIWALSHDDREVRDRDLPVDVFLDAGLRIDTEIGIFELTFANALGRVPL